ncbi:mannose-1-phosphate guanylyltransferase [Paenibacillus terrae HPL-003]|uniref:Mannose-1-phosphate guanylyltransferase n=1 Tax=Paenibacillus terrae (strain HPL-003) TaxID=985665 RepID=G7VTG6_PAETH|nr:sugar phosphate nucleotidyltransferase [Paenibacillus terrae]AET56849.1 mannose-1-phosphate guanylyltransferase [Paenibacillus terrae HPL-003]
MRMILLSGGSGKRLWPLSNESRPKQFLTILRHDERPESMLQRIWRQLSEANLAGKAYFSTSGTQGELIRGQIGAEAVIIEEPTRRDTFPAISLAAAYLHDRAGASRDEIVGVMPVDGYAGDEFFDHLRRLPSILEQSGSDIALMGAVPTEPSDKYGYIVPSSSPSPNQPYLRVSSFVEKPDLIRSEALIREGALWNCGVFAFRLGFLLDMLEQKGLSSDYASLSTNYEEMPKTSFDIAVVEQTRQLSVLPYHGEWRDLGTWDSLVRERSSELSGPGYISEASHDSHIINELEIPVSIWNVPDIIVVAGPDGVLVTDRQSSTGIKDMVAEIEIGPRFEERFWGKQTVLSHQQATSGLQTVTKRVVISAGRFISYHEHQFRKEVWTIVSGVGSVCIDGIMQTVNPGEVIVVEPGTKHYIGAIEGDLEFIESQIGHIVSETDIIRYEFPDSI